MQTLIKDKHISLFLSMKNFKSIRILNFNKMVFLRFLFNFEKSKNLKLAIYSI